MKQHIKVRPQFLLEMAKNLSKAEVLVLFSIMFESNRNYRFRTTKQTRETVCQQTNLSDKTVCNCISSLHKKKFIKRVNTWEYNVMPQKKKKTSVDAPFGWFNINC